MIKNKKIINYLLIISFITISILISGLIISCSTEVEIRIAEDKPEDENTPYPNLAIENLSGKELLLYAIEPNTGKQLGNIRLIKKTEDPQYFFIPDVDKNNSSVIIKIYIKEEVKDFKNPNATEFYDKEELLVPNPERITDITSIILKEKKPVSNTNTVTFSYHYPEDYVGEKYNVDILIGTDTKVGEISKEGGELPIEFEIGRYMIYYRFWKDSRKNFVLVENDFKVDVAGDGAEYHDYIEIPYYIPSETDNDGFECDDAGYACILLYNELKETIKLKENNSTIRTVDEKETIGKGLKRLYKIKLSNDKLYNFEITNHNESKSIKKMTIPLYEKRIVEFKINKDKKRPEIDKDKILIDGYAVFSGGGSKLVSPTLNNIKIPFSEPMSQVLTEESVSLSDERNMFVPIASKEWSENKKVLNLFFEETLTPNLLYILKLNKYAMDLNANPINGNKNRGQFFEIRFKTDKNIFYVSQKKGNKNNSGTSITEPMSSIKNAIDYITEKKLSNINIFVEDGQYTEPIELVNFKNISLIAKTENRFDETTDKVILNTKNKDYTIIINNSTNINIEGFKIINKINMRDSTAIIINNSTNINIKKNLMKTESNKKTYAIKSSFSNNISITNNTINGGSSSYSCGVYVNDSNGAIHSNSVNAGEGINSSYAIRVMNSSDLYVANNILNAGDSIKNSYGLYISNSKISIVNNTIFVGESANPTGIFYKSNAPKKIINNLIFDYAEQEKNSISIKKQSQFETTIDNNYLFDEATAFSIYRAFENVDGKDSNIFTMEDNDWHLTKDAPEEIRENGKNLSKDPEFPKNNYGEPIDKDSKPRQGFRWTIGAYSY